MNSILPLKYLFDNSKVLTPSRTNLSWLDKCPLWLFWSVIIGLMLILTLICYAGSFSEGLPIDDIAFSIFMTFSTIVCIGFANSTTNHFTTLDDAYNQPYDLNCNFKLRDNSNLIVRQDKNQRPFKSTDSHAYPYRLYVKNTANTNQLIYLGQTNTQKEIFLDDNSKTSELFASYCNYIKKHHLADKFKQKLYFVRDNSVTDANGIAQYVLKGDGITLKIKQNEHNKCQIYAVKE